MGQRESNGRFSGQRVNAVGIAAMSTSAGADACIKQASPRTRKEELAVEMKREEEHATLQRDGERLLHTMQPVYTATQDQLSNELHRWFAHQGFWPEGWNPSRVQALRYAGDVSGEFVTIPFAEYVRLKKMEKLGLIVTEVAECMEAVRKDDFDNEVEELGDIDVRMHDYKGGFGMTDLHGGFGPSTAAEGFIAKMLKNFQRPFRHGKKF